MIEDIIYITIIVLLPIIPAYILYKTLPSRAMVRGPFKGLDIQLTGSFGGYFLLVLVLIGFVHTRPKPLKTQYEVWKVVGTTGFKEEDSSLKKEDIRFTIRPPYGAVNKDGSFKIDILVKPGHAGVKEFPILNFEHPERDNKGKKIYTTETVHLEEKKKPLVKYYKPKHHESTKTIEIGLPVLLQREGEYKPTGPPPELIENPEEVNT